MEDRCIACGEIIPEGQQVCKICQEGWRMKEKEKATEIGLVVRTGTAKQPGYIRSRIYRGKEEIVIKSNGLGLAVDAKEMVEFLKEVRLI